MIKRSRKWECILIPGCLFFESKYNLSKNGTERLGFNTTEFFQLHEETKEIAVYVSVKEMCTKNRTIRLRKQQTTSSAGYSYFIILTFDKQQVDVLPYEYWLTVHKNNRTSSLANQLIQKCKKSNFKRKPRNNGIDLCCRLIEKEIPALYDCEYIIK